MFEFEEHDFEEMLKKHERTKETLQEDVKVLREWMMGQPHLPEILDSKYLQNFLLLNKCNIERAKEKIDNYYTVPTKLADDMMHPNSPEMQKSLEILYFVTLPRLTQEKYRIWVFKIRNKDRIDEMNPIEALNRSLHVQEIRLNEDHMFGDVLIFDMGGINFGYMTKLTPVVLAKKIACYEKIYSIPLKSWYFINSGPIVAGILKILKTIMKPKLFQRIHVCADASILEKDFEKDVLPSDYGGNGKSLEEIQDAFKRKLIHYQDRFDKVANFLVDENLRPEKLKNDEILGYYGSFRRINFD